MKNRGFWFNTYLELALVLAIGAGCASTASDGSANKKRQRQEAVLRLHLETNPDVAEHVGTATVGRTSPFTLTVEKKAFLTELNIVKADLIEAADSYALGVQFDQKGTWILDQYSTANKGRRIAVWAEFGEIRWIAAPRITQRLADGKVLFTPDVTREEAEKIVDGLNYVAEKIRKGRK
jgi:preprotein translocase subunit SecD